MAKKDFSFKVVEEFGILSENEKGYRKELRLVSFSEAEPKYDIRTWWDSEDGEEKMGKGVTLTLEEIKELKKLLRSIK